MRILLLLLWFGFMAAATFWLPGYDAADDLGGEGPIFIPAFVVVLVVALFAVRERAESVRTALLSTLPGIALLAFTWVMSVLGNAQMAEYRGGPLYLYFAVTLWGSWAALMLSTALVTRTKWTTVGGIAVTLLVCLVGYFFYTARID